MSKDKVSQTLYKAEFAVREVLDQVAASEDPFTITVAGSSLVIPLERKFGRVEDVQTYVDLCCHVLGHRAVPRVRKSHGNSKHAHGGGWLNEIDLPTAETHAAGKGKHTNWALREIVVLHELAHCITRAGGHGPEFAGTFLKLIKEFMGTETWLLAVSTFDAAGVDIDHTV